MPPDTGMPNTVTTPCTPWLNALLPLHHWIVTHNLKGGDAMNVICCKSEVVVLRKLLKHATNNYRKQLMR